MSDYEKEMDVAIQAVRKAADVCRNVQRDMVKEDSLAKKDKSPVTVADFASQAIVCFYLKQAFGDVEVVGEENSSQLRQAEQSELRNSVVKQVQSVLGEMEEKQVLSLIDLGGAVPTKQTKRFWTIDPVDGTKGFLRKQQYAIALALIEDGQVVLGALACPNLPIDSTKMDTNNPCGTLAVARRGQPTLMYKLEVDSTAPLEGATTLQFSDRASENPQLHGGRDARPTSFSEFSDEKKSAQSCFCESVDSGHSDQSWSAKIAENLNIAAPPVRIDSQAKYAVVARGGASIYLRLPVKADYQENIWDHAAGAIVVKQAGGKVTDINGKELDFSCGRTLAKNKGVVATIGEDHQRVVKAIADAK